MRYIINLLNYNSNNDIASIEESVDKVLESITYSTTEREVGTWIDGEKLYEKVYEVTNPVSGQVIETITGVEIKSIQAIAKRGDNSYFQMPYYDGTTSIIYRIFISVSVNGAISVVIGGYSISKIIAIVRYTKNS